MMIARMSQLTSERSTAGHQRAGDDSKDIVVFWNRRDTKCAECGTELRKGSFLRM
jgi:hypothetical protein